MTYYKKIERDKVRNAHLRDIQALEDEMAQNLNNQEEYDRLYIRRDLLLLQLRLYDELKGYKKTL